MPKYKVFGNEYNVDDTLQGEELSTAMTEIEADSKQKNVSKFLSVLGRAEGADYTTIVGGGKFKDFTAHPRVVGLRTKEGPSTAAGRYQITATTYDEFSKKTGVTGFDPEAQDRIALAIIEQEGALDQIKEGDFRGAIGKLGGRWASLPSSKYSQPKRSQQWIDKEFGLQEDSKATPSTAAVEAGAAPAVFSYGAVPKKVDPAKLEKSGDWLTASKQIFKLRNGQDFEGSDTEAAEFGKSFMGRFNSNLPMMALYTRDLVANGTKEDKEAFLYLMDTYDNTEFSWEGAGRAALGMVTDPTNLATVASLGIGGAGKVVASTAAKQGLKQTILTSLGRTGIVAGIDAGIMGAAQSSIKQTVEVTGGRRDGISLGKVAADAGIAATAGVVLGTTADAAVATITNVVRRGPAKAAEAKALAAAQGSTVVPSTAPPTVPSTFVAKADAVVPSVAPPVVTAAVVPEGEASAAVKLADVLLSKDEIAAATARKQEGRLWVDDLPPVVPAYDELARGLAVPDTGSGLRSTPRTNAMTVDAGTVVKTQLADLSNRDLAGVLESLRNAPYTPEQRATVDKGVQLHHADLQVEQVTLIKKLGVSTNAKETTEMVARLAEVEDRLVPLTLADDAMGSMAGSLLQQRQANPLLLKGTTVESLMAENPGMTKLDADALYVRMFEDAAKDKAIQSRASEYDALITAADKAGDTAEMAKQQALKYAEMRALMEEKMPGSASFFTKANELVISNVFTPTTVAINLVPAAIKTLVLPALRALVSDPLKLATRVELTAAYTGMKSSIGGAFRAAVASYRYEQSLLTRGTGRLMEGELALTGKAAGYVRFFPRLLNATDEFLGQVNYSGYVSGRAAAQAAIEGTEKGMTGKLLSDYIKNAAKIAVEESRMGGTSEELLQPIVNKGVNLGLTGDALYAYIRQEAARDPASLRQGTSEAALDFVRDVLYKRDFSGQGAASKGAKNLENLLNTTPAIKLLSGQLFFRTPIRVFEEGIRLTPGLQFVAPHFIDDLAGKNGALRQVRAQGEALTSIAITGAVVSMYAAGTITGDGAYSNWKAGRTAEDGPGQPAYTIKMEDGSTWKYRNFDPVATPFKIIINGLERLDKLMIRQAQGEDISQTAFDQAQAYVTVGTSAIAAALRDANLAGGVDSLMKLAENLGDPEGKEDAWLKFFGEKLGLLVPNTLTKIAKQNDPTLKDPADFWQVVETRLAGIYVDREDIKTSYSYDVLGNVRQISDTGTLWNIFSKATNEERAKGMSADEQSVMLELDRLQRVTGAVFTPPLRHKSTGSMDLRTVLTSDGKETLYDRWQANYKALDPASVLLPILQAPYPEGTFKFKGEKTSQVQEQITELREAAFQQLMAEEQKVLDKVIDLETQKAKAAGGLLDFRPRSN